MRTQKELNAERTLDAAQRVAEIQLRYARQGFGLAHAAMAGATVLENLRHYPAQDVVDPAAGTRFYYHAHGSRRCPAQEHGHFHLFAYPGGTPSGPDFMHLAGLSLDARGQPFRWFTTNRWVTGERWHPASEVLAALETFTLETRGRMAPVARWVSAMVQLFQPQLAALVRRRDAVLARRMTHQDADTAFEDRRLDVVTECHFSLSARLQQLSR